jgi:hypothetical protein
MSYRQFLGSYTSASERYAEVFYGILMVTGCTGLVALGVPKEEAGVLIMFYTALIVNILWGLIDGFTVIYGTMVDDVAEDLAVKNLRADGGDEAAEEVLDNLDGSLVGKMKEEDKAEVVKVIRSAKSYMPVVNRIGLSEIKRILAIFSLDFICVFPVAIPYLLADDVTVAARWYFVIATFLMAFLGYRWAKYARMRRWTIALAFGSFTIFLLILSFLLGGI